MKKLFGHPDSGHAFKVRFFMLHAGIEHDYEVVDIWKARDQRSEEFQAAATFGEVPLLLEDGQAWVQSNAILMHLARETGLWGFESAERQTLCEQWLVWEANKIGLCIPQIRVFERFEKDNETLRQAMPWLTARYAHDVGVLEETLSTGQPWLVVGDTPTIADFSTCAYLQYADEARLSVPPRVSDWLQRLSELPGYKHPYELLA